MTIYYMHTLDGQPAAFCGSQVCFIGRRGIGRLCRTLDELREQQRKSEAYRRRNGFATRFEYGYRRVRVPSEAKPSTRAARKTPSPTPPPSSKGDPL